VGQDSSVGIVTSYGLDGLGIQSWPGRDFPHPSRLYLGTIQPPIQWVLVLFPRGSSGLGAASITHRHLVSRLKTVELQLYSLSGLSWPVTGANLPLLSVSQELRFKKNAFII